MKTFPRVKSWFSTLLHRKKPWNVLQADGSLRRKVMERTIFFRQNKFDSFSYPLIWFQTTFIDSLAWCLPQIPIASSTVTLLGLTLSQNPRGPQTESSSRIDCLPCSNNLSQKQVSPWRSRNSVAGCPNWAKRTMSTTIDFINASLHRPLLLLATIFWESNPSHPWPRRVQAPPL